MLNWTPVLNYSKKVMIKISIIWQHLIYLYCYPRRQRSFINSHSDKLEDWSKKNYLQYLDELNKYEIIQRRNTYSVDRFSNSIKINWKFRNPNNAILDDGRSPDTFEDTIRLSYEPEEFRELLQKLEAEEPLRLK